MMPTEPKASAIRLGICVAAVMAFVLVLARPILAQGVYSVEPPPLDANVGCLTRAQFENSDGQGDLELEDRDGDFSRNKAKILANWDNLCIKQHVFREGELRWVLHIIQHKPNPIAVFMFVPHDDKQASFDMAIDAVVQHGGTVVAVETGGQRNNGPQDPNRNFLAGSPIYSENVMRWHPQGTPVICFGCK